MASRLRGNTEYYMGAIEENAGKILGNKDWETAGVERKTKGQAEIEAAKTQGYQEGLGDKAKGSAQQAAGDIKGDTSQKSKGMANDLSGEAKMRTNK
ncbi:hypothetical protein EV182_003251 [Spiromyces aspiralis]|uniref:Uncharacterized protein n=1 Tax=Spiromyces aspiralis TaxID=68401 RepID=A0ACC1HQN5_9FUNG|nr:hypothetical protein EV182_003251 [Spiromyces aspiralis]